MYNCRDDMLALWEDTQVRTILRKRNVRPQEMSGFFLDDLERVTDRNYEPTSDDVVRARLKTVGVSEHIFTIESRTDKPEWRVYDVGGSRSQRAAWIPFFDDVNAIFFIAPISAFDQCLDEDSRVNRLEDSLLLWKQLVSSKLLRNVELILLLNKVDILGAKLRAGVQFSKFVTSYTGKNTTEGVGRYLKMKFLGLLKQHSPVTRQLHCHMTTATDTRTTSSMLTHVQDLLLRQNLENSQII